MDIIVEGKTPNDIATRSNLDAWVARVPLPFTATLDSVDPQPTMETFFGTPRDQFILIDLKTMTFIDIFAADPRGAIKAVEALLPPVDGDGGTPDM